MLQRVTRQPVSHRTGAFVIADAPDSKDKPGRTFQVWSISSVGIEMGLCILIGFGIGYWLDKRYDTAPYLMLLFLFFGIAAGFKALFRAARQAKDAAAESEDKRP